MLVSKWGHWNSIVPVHKLPILRTHFDINIVKDTEKSYKTIMEDAKLVFMVLIMSVLLISFSICFCWKLSQLGCCSCLDRIQQDLVEEVWSKLLTVLITKLSFAWFLKEWNILPKFSVFSSNATKFGCWYAELIFPLDWVVYAPDLSEIRKCY